MSRYRKIVWNEGMLLTPHHFQQWDNYYEELLNSRLSSLEPYEWGVLDLQVNREAVSNGDFQIVRCRAVLPDGLMIDVPDNSPAPNLRPVEGHFPAEAERLGVHLAIPAKKQGSANFQSNGASANLNVRFLQEGALVVDETSGTNEQPLAFARTNLRILFDDELRDGFTSIKIAELEKTATGGLQISENYIPPILNVSASSWLANMLRQIVEILITKSGSLGEQRRQRGASLADFTTSEVAIFWLLHTVNASIPTFSHLFRTRLVHPEKLYLEMAELAGRLMTFAVGRHPKDIVAYDHTDLYTTFSELSALLRELLETVIPTRCVPIPLEKIRDTLYVGRITDDRLLKEAAFYLAVRAEMPENKLIEVVPRVVKIASRDVIEAVIGSALPGVTLTHQSPPPAAIPTRLGFHYFGLETVRNPYWDGIKGAKTLAVYVPNEIPDERLEMYAVKP
ncbi:MAG TPA: type VI secretion system baseplate subunit TssK [Pyrinomonadaceae bacterium]|nr:type VI secretion system baseplate subunit TssK [Pyrinomonadaceae bacterium]